MAGEGDKSLKGTIKQKSNPQNIDKYACDSPHSQFTMLALKWLSKWNSLILYREVEVHDTGTEY